MNDFLLAYLPYSELTDEIEQAISRWISNPSNRHYFPAPSEARWSATMQVMIQGPGPDGREIRMVSHSPLPFAGRMVTTE